MLDHLLRSFGYGNVHLYTLNISDLMFTWLVNTRRKWKCKWKDSAFRIERAEVNPKSQNNSSTTHLALPSFSHVWSQLVPRYWPTSFGWHFEKEIWISFELVLAYLCTHFLRSLSPLSLPSHLPPLSLLWPLPLIGGCKFVLEFQAVE